MDTKIIAEVVADLEAQIIKKGYMQPTVYFAINWLGSPFTCRLGWRAYKQANEQYEFCHGDTPESALEQAEAYVTNMQPVSESAREAVLKLVQDAVRDALTMGVSVEDVQRKLGV